MRTRRYRSWRRSGRRRARSGARAEERSHRPPRDTRFERVAGFVGRSGRVGKPVQLLRVIHGHESDTTRPDCSPGSTRAYRSDADRCRVVRKRQCGGARGSCRMSAPVRECSHLKHMVLTAPCSPLQLCHPLGVECRFPDGWVAGGIAAPGDPTAGASPTRTPPASCSTSRSPAPNRNGGTPTTGAQPSPPSESTSATASPTTQSDSHTLTPQEQ